MTITIGKVDVTQHVAAMFDALVASLDWGSGFLDVETIESILIVAELAGFDVSKLDINVSDYKSLPGSLPGSERVAPAIPATRAPTIPYPGAPASVNEAYEAWVNERSRQHREWRSNRTAAIAAWRVQVAAKARAMRDDEG